ncbi:hypothetical protein SAMN02990966_00626 [Rhodospirillales bacterium URHD0017]|nr:hypothetical protein SAMN02990966_00626 [Rhodospirillales bacterium URHD0017]
MKTMNALSAASLASVLLAGAVAQAQAPALTFDNAAYVTCREAQAMAPEARTAVATFLIEHAARRRGVTIPSDERGTQLGLLVRGGCTLYPDSYLLTVVDRAVMSEQSKLPKRQ